MKSWTPQEDQKLVQLYEKTVNFKKWKVISDELRQFGISKTQYQCRERYVNKLDPSVRQDKWDSRELKKIFQLYENFGSQWRHIQKFLQGRTQSAIKNKFYGILRNFVRGVLSLKGVSKDQIQEQLTTTRLTDMFEGKKQFRKIKNFVRDSLRAMNYKTTKEDILTLIEEEVESVDELLRIVKRSNASEGQKAAPANKNQPGSVKLQESYELNQLNSQNGGQAKSVQRSVELVRRQQEIQVGKIQSPETRCEINQINTVCKEYFIRMSENLLFGECMSPLRLSECGPPTNKYVSYQECGFPHFQQCWASAEQFLTILKVLNQSSQPFAWNGLQMPIFIPGDLNISDRGSKGNN